MSQPINEEEERRKFVEARLSAKAEELRREAESEWAAQKRHRELADLHTKLGYESVEELIVALAAHLKNKRIVFQKARDYHKLSEAEKNVILDKIRNGMKRSGILRDHPISASTYTNLAREAKQPKQ